MHRMPGRNNAGASPVSTDRLSFQAVGALPLWDRVYYMVPPPPCLQNPENKRFILPLRARSLNFKDLHAKSREHGSYGGDDVILSPISELEQLDRGLEATQPWVRLSKIDDYLTDNEGSSILSGLGHTVNDKATARGGRSIQPFKLTTQHRAPRCLEPALQWAIAKRSTEV